jgi:hypothetical protein
MPEKKMKKARPVTRAMFLAHMKLKLEEFDGMWAQEHSRSAADWPLTQDSIEDWEEQFRAFMSWDE